jgi:hypothetical protein
MMRILLSITLTVLGALIGYVLLSALVVGSLLWAIAGAIVFAVVGFWLGGFAVGGADGHHGIHTRT